ncbi:MAG: 6,7-dimethyl-8-ribityllumazine synthase [Actinomycetota bacterium]|nr:MAG: 6,7-dimethyl-8-ribityllumazine synthase [Actinomycetota bacterium]
MSSYSEAEAQAYSGSLKVAENDAYVLVASRYNDFITRELIDGVTNGLKFYGASEKNIELVRVPGAMEIPLAAKWLAATGRYCAIICLGSVIRGATTHYEVVVNACSEGVARVGLESGVPTIFGVLTTENIEQAIERSEMTLGNKGHEFAATAIEMVALKRSI